MKVYYLIVYCVDNVPSLFYPRLFFTFGQAKSHADFSLSHKNFSHTERFNNYYIKSIIIDISHDLPF